MTVATREQIMTALFAKLQGITFAALTTGDTAFKVTSRKLVLWDQAIEQPALYMAEHAEQDTYQNEITPIKKNMGAELFVYQKNGDPEVAIAPDLNVMLDAISAALTSGTDPFGRQTLGGLVSHCRIEGTILKDPGDLDRQALMIIPIKILVP